MKSGMLAADSIFKLLSNQDKRQNKSTGLEPIDYQIRLKNSWIWQELYDVRNFRPSFHTPLGVFGGILYSALYFFPFRGREPFTLQHGSLFFFLYIRIFIISF